MVLPHTRLTHAHMDPPNGLEYVLPRPDLVGLNALTRFSNAIKGKNLHDILVNINTKLCIRTNVI